MCRALAIASLVLMLFAAPAPAAAHVNQTVGPYSVFLVLIEEPFFTTNRAGFEFWVHEGDRPVQGLDRTLQAVAANATRKVELAVSPMNDRGFYDVETDRQGRPFDPGTGGDWTLRLTGTVEGTPVDVTIPTAFPAYPRVATGGQPPAAVSTVAPTPDIWVLAQLTLLLAAIVWIARRMRGHPTERSAPKPIA